MSITRRDVAERVSMLDALEALDLPVPDRNGKISCPFHAEDTPSCHIYDDRFYCFGCQANGDVVWFVAKVTGSKLWQAIQFLTGGDEDSLEGRPVLRSTQREPRDLSEFFFAEYEGDIVFWGGYVPDKWGFSLGSLITRWGVKVTRQGLWIPHHDDEHRIVGVKVRFPGGDKTSVKGSTFPRLYGAPLHPDGVSVVVCEGESDTWTMDRYVEAPFTPVVSPLVVGLPSGAGTFKPEWADWLADAGQVVLALDDDEAGRSATQRIRADLAERGQKNVTILRPPHGDVADSLAAGWRPEL